MWVAAAACLVFLVVAAASLRRPGAALALAMCMFAFDQVLTANLAFFADNSSLTNYAVALACGVALVVSVLTGTYRFRGVVYPVWICALGYLILAVFGAQWSLHEGAFRVLDQQLPYLTLYVLIAPLLLSHTRDAEVGLTIAAWLTALAAVYVAFDSSIWWSTQRLALRVAGQARAVNNPLALGDVGGMAFILAVLAPGFERWTSPKTLLRYVICAISLLVTAKASRGETVAALVSASVFFVALGERRSRLVSKSVAVVILALVSGAVLATVLQSEVGVRYQQNVLSRDAQQRFDSISVVLERFVDAPEAWLFGLGTHSSRALLGGGYPHNHIVQALVEQGVVGLALWLGVVGFAFFSLVRTWRGVDLDERNRFVLGALGALLSYHFIVGFKRGGPLAGSLLMVAILCERFAQAVRAEVASTRAGETSERLEASG